MSFKDQTLSHLQQGYDFSIQWLTSAAAWSQFGLLVVSFLAAYYLHKKINPTIEALLNPEGPDCELRGFGDSGIDFCVEFWVGGIDDGKNKYTSDVLFLVWNALKKNNIEIPYPRRVIEIKGTLPAND